MEGRHLKAIVYRQYGSVDVLKLEDVAKPIPKSDEILIRIHAAEATKSDCELRSFRFPVAWFWLPLRLAMGIRKPRRPILGSYFAGEVVAVGKDVSRFTVGDAIFGCTGLSMGAYGEYLCVSATATLVKKPNNLTYEEAAAVPLGGLNALHFMRRANIQKGETVVINGAGGSIGTFAVQLAKQMGAIVTAVDSGIKEDMLRQQGADHFVDYQKQDFAENDQAYDVIFDMVAASSYTKCIKSLKPKGRYLTANPTVYKMLRSLWTSKLSDKTAIFALAAEREDELMDLKKMIEAGEIRPVIGRVFEMQQVREAHVHVETEQRLGTVVLRITQ